MLDALRLLQNPALHRLVNSAPRAAELYALARRAIAGDADALQSLKQNGWMDALEIVQPGAGAAAAAAVMAARTMARAGVVDGEWREIADERQPWDRFTSWITARRWGAYILLGPKGSGKTVLALRLAQLWSERSKWPVEVVNVYPDDAPSWVIRVSARRFASRLMALSKYLDLDDYGPIEDSDGEPTGQVEIIDIERFKRRIIVVDEASLIGTSLGKQRGRDMLQAIMAQARHLEWQIVLAAQTAKMVPLALLGTADAVFVKRPAGGEAWTDRVDTPEIEQLWQRAGEAFRSLHQSPFWPAAPDPRKWTYAETPDIGGGHPWAGMVPVFQPTD